MDIVLSRQTREFHITPGALTMATHIITIGWKVSPGARETFSQWMPSVLPPLAHGLVRRVKSVEESEAGAKIIVEDAEPRLFDLYDWLKRPVTPAPAVGCDDPIVLDAKT